MTVVVAGSLNLDLVGRAPRIPGPGETVMGQTLARFHGGKGGNQAVAAARLGAAVRFFGAVGRDAAGDELLAGLAAEHIDVAGVARVDTASGCALITVSEAGENAITVLPGANREAPLPTEGALRGARCVVLQMEVPPAANQAWAAAARAAGVPVMLNAAPAGADAVALLPWTDLLLVNEGELAQLCAQTGHAEAALGPATVVTTLGERGCRVWHRGREVAVPGRPVDVVDTTGAGDTFAGALAAALAAGKALIPAVTEANVAAALSCRRPGARGGMPSRAELDAALAEA
ncbi:MAG: ribokinase [Burkholderiales bacterium]|nr:ribokinase [Burkholderiales bacterium]